jgi:hypothetical protein
VTAGPFAGKVGLVTKIDHRGVDDNCYEICGHDDRSLGWFDAGQLVIEQYCAPKPPKGWVAPENPVLDEMERMLARPRA